MDEIVDIFKMIKRKEYKYKKKTLVGLIHISENQYVELEKKAKSILTSYQYQSFLNSQNSDVLSIYAIIYNMYQYDGERFWESLALRLKLEEKFIRETTIEAMKVTYKNHGWGLYKTTRNEYVETIRMHGIIGNDSSGDKIIYALYVIYLKDFDKKVTKEKLDLFFPFLREVFRNDESSSDELASNFEMTGITYIRGQIPKSFMRAYLLNTSAIATLMKNIFCYFEYMEFNSNKPDSLNKRIENKIKMSFERNNNFNNEYTKNYIYKKTPKIFHQDKVEYRRKSVQLIVPTHFINFQSNEKKEVILKVYNSKQELKNLQLKTAAGGIGWKTNPTNLILGRQYKNIRYTLEKKDTKEIIYDSKESLFEKSIKKDPIENVMIIEPPTVRKKVHTLYPHNKKDETALGQLKRGYIYEISPPGKLEIADADYKKTEDSLCLLVTENTELNDGSITYKIDDNSKLATYYEQQFIPGINVGRSSLEFKILKEAFKFSIVLRSPYSLSDLELRVNEETYDGVTIRKRFLKDVNVLENGDLEYILELSEELIAKEINSVQTFLNIDDMSLRYTQFNFYYDPKWHLRYQEVKFQNKTYIQVKAKDYLDESKKTVYLTNQKLRVFLKDQGQLIQVLLNVKEIEKEISPLSSQDFINTFLVDFESKQMISNENKNNILNKIRSDWGEKLTQLINDLVKISTSETFIINLLNDHESFKESLISCLNDVESEFVNHVITELKAALIGDINAKSVYKPYVTKILKVLYANDVRRENKNKIVEAMRLYQVPLNTKKIYADTNNALRYQLSNKSVDDIIATKNINKHISQKNQILSSKLYQLAMKYKGNEIGLIKNVREIQEEFPDNDTMTYYEVVILFHSVVNEKKAVYNLSNSRLFMDIFYQFAIDYNRETICEYMNGLEEFIGKNKERPDSNILRKRLVLLARSMSLNIVIKTDR